MLAPMTDQQLSAVRELRQAILSRRAAERAFLSDPLQGRKTNEALAAADIRLRECENQFVAAFQSGVPAARKAVKCG